MGKKGHNPLENTDFPHCWVTLDSVVCQALMPSEDVAPEGADPLGKLRRRGRDSLNDYDLLL